jgi:hypothetical protein
MTALLKDHLDSTAERQPYPAGAADSGKTSRRGESMWETSNTSGIFAPRHIAG